MWILKKVLMKILIVFFAVFFIVILFNTIFFNKTLYLTYSIPVMIIGTILVYLIIFAIYHIYKKKNLTFLEHIPKKRFIFLAIILIFIIQCALAVLTYSEIGWDCGRVVGCATLSVEDYDYMYSYFATYPNNIGILLVFKYLMKVVKAVTNVSLYDTAFLIAIIFNIIMVDIAAVFTFLTAKKVFGNKYAYFSLIFILPLILFSPYIIIPYTDTITMAFPIILLYLYINIRELPNNSIKKYLLIYLFGLISALGIILKPTVGVILVAIVIIEILNMRTYKLKHILYFLLSVLVLVLGIGLVVLCYDCLKYKNLGISDKDYYYNQIPFTHYIMMGLNDEIEYNGKTMYGGYNDDDYQNTVSVPGYQSKMEYNIAVIKERLSNFGFFGYIEFLYNKLNWILSDGTFFYGGEGNWKSSECFNTSVVGKFLQQFVDSESDVYKNVTANIMQITWILVTMGLIFSICKDNDDNINLGKVIIIGIILFTTIFEGRSRYLVNHLPIFIFVGTYGLANSLKLVEKVFNRKKA